VSNNGKHIRVKKLAILDHRILIIRASFLSNLWLALMHGCFITVDVGDLGRNGDRGVLTSGAWSLVRNRGTSGSTTSTNAA
jgi:hypothetical protein